MVSLTSTHVSLLWIYSTRQYLVLRVNQRHRAERCRHSAEAKDAIIIKDTRIAMHGRARCQGGSMA